MVYCGFEFFDVFFGWSMYLDIGKFVKMKLKQLIWKNLFEYCYIVDIKMEMSL